MPFMLLYRCPNWKTFVSNFVQLDGCQLLSGVVINSVSERLRLSRQRQVFTQLVEVKSSAFLLTQRKRKKQQIATK